MEYTVKTLTELAAQIEDSGVKFYKNLMSVAKDIKVKQMLSFFIDQEILHKEKFIKLAAELGVKNEISALTGPLENRLLSLATLFKHSAMDIASFAKETLTLREGIDISINLEEKAITMFEEMRKLLPDDSVEPLDKIIAEEQNHLTLLKSVKSKAHFPD
jgi:rubrerythrin